MKKFISVILFLSVLAFSLSSCSVQDKSVITVNDTTDVDAAVFTYFLNDAYYSDKGYTESECIDIATSESLKYIAVNTRFAQTAGSLTLDEKADVSQEVNALWRIYGDYLTEIGVTKDAYFKIKQYEYCKENLRFSLYDTNGTQPINEAYIQQYFTTNYVGIKYFYQELYTVKSADEIAAMSDYDRKIYESSKQSAQSRYEYISSLANYVNSSVYTMNEAFMAATGEIYADVSVSATVIDKQSSSFSAEFIDAVTMQSVGSAFIITNSDRSYIYLIERIDLLDTKYDFYSQYRDICLKAVSESYFNNEINSWVQSYTAVRHLSVAEKCLTDIKKVDRSKYVGTDGYEFNSFQLKR
ncbi:MAG: hypothetical protein IJZ35_04755 [Clostridia bacterium]|nr:hypothetical protein [Clostridia bacterium]